MFTRQIITTGTTTPLIKKNLLHNNNNNNKIKNIIRILLQKNQQKRNFVSKAPGSNPLDVLRNECMARQFCDVDGSRLPGTHWVFSIAISPIEVNKPPNLRTVGIERVSNAGIDFIMKRGSPTASNIQSGCPIAVLHQQGNFLPGESAEQWRAEGICNTIPLGEILDLIPHFTVTSIVASTKLATEKNNASTNADGVSDGRLAMMSKSHVTEVIQRTRLELENGDIPFDTLNDCIIAFRFQPNRMECMLGGPDSIMWDRWEWLRNNETESDNDIIVWNEPKHLIPH